MRVKLGQDGLQLDCIVQSMWKENEELVREIQGMLPEGCSGVVTSAEQWDPNSGLEGLDNVIVVTFKCEACRYEAYTQVLLGEPTRAVCDFFPVDVGGLYTVSDRTRTRLKPSQEELCWREKMSALAKGR